MAALQIIKKWDNKSELAHFVKEECLRSSSGKPQQLNELLNYLLDPEKTLKDASKIELYDWCRALVAGGMPYKEFEATVRQYDNATVCGLVWTSNFVAYRCRTCAVSPCMSLCADCFQAGQHVGHDYNMFRSQAGGACDCGDVNVMAALGFCPRHGPEHAQRQATIPPDLLVVADAMMPRLLWRLVLHMRSKFDTEIVSPGETLTDAGQFIKFLHDLSDLGAGMRQVITKAASDVNIYKNFLEEVSNSSCEDIQLLHERHLLAMGTLSAPDVPSEFSDIPGLDVPLIHETLLDELVFWMVKFEFPQNIVTFLLSILPDDDYKVAFTKSFIKHYSRIFTMLIRATGRQQRQQISNRVVHISVQLLSPQSLATKMVTEDKLMYIMLSSLKYMINLVLTNTESVSSDHTIVDCNSDILKDHCYWPIVSDIINVLSHKEIAYDFMSNDKLLQFWFSMISCYQGMNINKRELITHVEFEPDSYYAAFSAELEICSSPMWSMLVHCKDQETQQYSRKVISIVIKQLQKWFEIDNLDVLSVPSTFEVSFHLPLHRYLAVFISNAVVHQGISLDSLLPSHHFLEMLMMHPLHLQVIFTEIFAGMWVRNGLQIRGQAMTYVQCHFANSMVDADIYILQICAAKLDPDHFVSTIFQRYHTMLSFDPDSSRASRQIFDADHHMPMLEGALTMIGTLLTFRTQLGMTEREVTRHDMVTLLCMMDRTHSQLMDMMPEKCGLTGQNKHFDDILKEVADYKKPVFEAGGTMQQGMYIPKAHIWEEEFDPLHAQLRAMHRRDYQASLDRYTEFVKSQGAYKGISSPWPPLRLPGPIHQDYIMLRKILHCRTMHGIIFTLLYKALTDKSTSDSMLYLTVYLLELAVSVPSPMSYGNDIAVTERQDGNFRSWFASDSILRNVREVVPEILITLRGEEALKEMQQHMATDGSGSPDILGAGFQLAPSPMSSSALGNRTAMMVVPQGTSPEIMSAVQAMLDEATNQVEAVENFVQSHTRSISESPSVRTQGVSVNFDSIKTNKPIQVNESMLSLLVKLHARLSGRVNSYVPESHRASTSQAMDTDSQCRVGDGPYFIGKLLDKICSQSPECAESVAEIYAKALPRDQGGKGKRKDMNDREERRRKAQERQKKLMAEFANKQKEFMEKVIHETSDMDLDEEDQGAHSIMVERTYDCVICNQTTLSTEERPVGLVTLLQPTSVLGHRRRSEDPVCVAVAKPTMQKQTTCASHFKERLLCLQYEFEETSCLMSVNIGLEGGVHAQTCGHHVHLDCQESYVKSLQSQQQQGLHVSKGEYWCPLCRQLANSALPISPDVGPAVCKPSPTQPKDMIRKLGELLALRPLTAGASVLTRAMHQVMEDVHKVTYPQYKQVSRNQSAESILLFVCSVLRTNLEVDILQRQGSLCTSPISLAPKKPSLLPLYQVLSLHSKMVTPQPFTNLWSHLTGISDGDPAVQTIQLFQKEVPVLLKDGAALFIELLLSLPVTLEKDVYQCLVRVLYNLVYVQALSYMTCRFADEERAAWRTTNKMAGTESLEGWMSVVIEFLSCCPIYEDDVEHPNMPAICQSVWSPQSVETCIQEYCLPFLRVVSLLQHHLYDEELPQVPYSPVDIQEEFTLLVKYLDLLPSNPVGALAIRSQASTEMAQSADCLYWYCDYSLKLVQGWCQHFVQYVKRNRNFARILLSDSHTWAVPQLISLPRDYDQIFRYYRKQTCENCKSLPHDPALCLVCGQLVCFKEDCCKPRTNTGEEIYECVQHSIDCGAGTCMFLIVNSSLIVVVRGSRAAVWGSVYLDDHGEEDKDLRRGKPLYLSEDRYKMLHQQWLTLSFDRVCKRWIFHNGKL